VPASKRLPECPPRLCTADLDALQPHDARYLAGIPAETFQVAAGDASLEARRVAMQWITREVRIGDVDAEVDDFRLRTNNMLVEGYRLALVPLWLLYYVVDERQYQVAVNGQTGAVTAERVEKGLLGWVKGIL
jgi:hypothetical protein